MSSSPDPNKNVRFTVVPTEEALPNDDTKLLDGDETDVFKPGEESSHGMALYQADINAKGKMSRVISSSSMDSPRRQTKVSFSEDVGNDEQKETKQGRGLGTLLGVYLPTVQNIFGVLIFIRVTWIVGMAGTFEGFLIIFLCCCTTTLTSISMSAIATNGIVPAGGSYFMISRALGPEFGGAVGLLFYLGFTVAGSMYVIGAIEILVTFIAPQISLFGDVTILSNALNNYRLFGTILLVLLFIICFIGVQFVAKFGPVSLFCVVISIICIYIGIFSATPENSVKVCFLGERILTLTSVTVNGTLMCTKNETGPIYQNYCNNGTCDPYFLANNASLVPGMPGLASGNFFKNIPHRYTEVGNLIGHTQPGNRDRGEIIADLTSTFTVLMAIYFPSVTGIMTGSNMSGDLKDAQKSIPIGTLAAVLSTSAIYLSCVLLFAGSIEGDLLRDKLGESLGGGLVIAYTAWPTKWMVLVGSFLSTIGAGLQSINTAPRLLYAISNDGIVPFLKIFGRTRRGEPFFALLLTVSIAEVGVLVGNLDYVTPVITMFFLVCYLFVNIACAVQTLLKAPSWRPRFRFYHWSLSLIAAGLCTTLMIVSSWYYALVTFAMASGIYKYIEFKGAEKEWGDGIRGMAMSLARYSLLKVQQTPPHTKNWRPQLLVLCKLDGYLQPKYDKMVDLAVQLKAGKGLTLVSTVLEGTLQDRQDDVSDAKMTLQKLIERTNVKGFKDVVVSKDVTSALSHLIQTAGLGGLKPNTVMMGWPYGWQEKQKGDTFDRQFIDTVEVVQAKNMALLVAKGVNSFPACSEKMKGTIDVWWIVHDGGMLLLLPYLLRQHKSWKNCKLRIFAVAQIEEDSIKLKQNLQKFMYQIRIEAQVEVVEMIENDISEYTYGRTLQMEQRAEMLKKMKMNNLTTPQVIADRIHRDSRPEVILDGVNLNQPTERRRTGTSINIEIGDICAANSKQNNSVSQTDSDSTRPQTMETLADNINKGVSGIFKPKDKNVQQMHTAVKLNEVIREHSKKAKLVIVNLPPPPRGTEEENAELHYMEFLEVLTEGLDRVLMVRGSGTEVITIYS